MSIFKYFFSTPFGTLAVVIILIAIPFTIIGVQHQQDIRQQASTTTTNSAVVITTEHPYVPQVIELMNQERQKNGGLPPLRMVTQLNTAADQHNNLMNECAKTHGTQACFSHQVTQLAEPNLLSRVVSIGYQATALGENIAWGQLTPAEVVAGWMASTQGHREAILNNGKWPDVGCGYLDGNNGDFNRIFWTCDFGKGTVPTPGNGNPTSIPTSGPTIQPTEPPRPTAPPFEPLAADVDKDGCVGILDFNAWLQAFQSGVIRSGTDPDIYKDGQINIHDFNYWFKAMLTLPQNKLC